MTEDHNQPQLPESTGGGGGGSPPTRPTIVLPPRVTWDSLFSNGGGGVSPGPMTMLAGLFTPGTESLSFSQLLSGAMSSPVAVLPPPLVPAEDVKSSTASASADERCGLAIAHPQTLPVPALLPSPSPRGLLDSPLFKVHFGMSHQELLAQMVAMAAQSHTQKGADSEYQFSFSPEGTPLMLHPTASSIETEACKQVPRGFDKGFDSVDKSRPVDGTIAEDGFNWRKYGQKQVKSSEHPRSYYKCTHPNCSVKKKVGRSFDGHTTDIIYKGQHNHDRPIRCKRSKEGEILPSRTIDSSRKSDSAFASEIVSQSHLDDFKCLNKISSDSDKIDGTSVIEPSRHYSSLTDGDDGDKEIGDTKHMMDDGDESEVTLKRSKADTKVAESASHRTVTECKIIVQTVSEVDLLDDGYRWRKYGQKVVKGNPNPRSYYKCTFAGCSVRKHIERAATNPKSVITTYEGKHDHELPGARRRNNSSAVAKNEQLEACNIMSGNQLQVDREDTESGVQHKYPVFQIKGENEIT